MQRAIFGMAMLALATALPSAPAAANDLGCQVLLCLSNPGGATQYAQCVAPMTKLWQRLATGGAFPGCSGGGVASPAWALFWLRSASSAVHPVQRSSRFAMAITCAT